MANMTALQRFERKPLSGRVNLIAIIEPDHSAARADRGWESGSGSEVVRHAVASDDSGDMPTGESGRVLAAALAAQIRRAFPGVNPLGEG